MTKVICELTGCKYNSSCCTSPADNKEYYCTKELIKLSVDEEICQLDCSMFEEDTEKEIECKSCQIKKYGGIRIPKDVKFEVTEVDSFKF